MTEDVRRWHHRPEHVFVPGTPYIVTAAVLHKQRLLSTPERLGLVADELLSAADRHGWRLQAWAVLANHYHFVALAPEDPTSLAAMVRRLHSTTARDLNHLDGEPGRRVWFQYWDTCITNEASYFARLNYVHNNPVKHGLVQSAEQYPFCSANWFQTRAEPAFRRKVESFRYDRVNVVDDF
jgi:putative transposase